MTCRRRTNCVVLATCLLCLGLYIQSAQSAELLSYPVHRLERAPELDGKVEGDPVWKGIPRATGFHVLGGRRKVTKQTWFKMGFTEDALYIGVVCEEPDIADAADQYGDGDPNIHRDNVVELFVWPAMSDKIVQVITNTKGAHTDYLNGVDADWHNLADAPVSRTAACRGQNTYSVEIEIPFDRLGHRPAGGDVWRGNVCRNNVVGGGKEDAFSTWARLVRRSLEPDHFAQLVFQSDGPAAKEEVIDSEGHEKDEADLHLIVDLRFDEGRGNTVHGQSAIINDGKIVGATWAPRGSGHCLMFEKKRDRVEIPNSDSLAGIKDAMTLECWAYFDLDKLAGTRGTLISSTPSSGFASGFYLDYVDEGTQTRSICFGVAGGGSSKRNWVYAENVIQTSGWHHIIATYDPKLTDGWRNKIYVDGQRQFLRPRPRDKEVVHRASRLPVFIGAKPASRAAMSKMTATFMGRIDEVKIWDTALTPEDIDRLYGSLWAKSTPLSPEPSAVIPDRKPHFTWTESADGTPYVFEMATVPDFTAETLVKKALPEAHYDCEKALSPGVYYWRVWSTDKAGKPTAACAPRALIVPFEHEFVPTDTTPPAMTDVQPPRDTTAESARPEISGRWSDDQGIDIKTAKLLLDGEDVTEGAEVTADGIKFTPASDLAKGVHTIEVSVKDTNGNPANRVRQHFTVDEPYRTVVKIDKDGRTRINGEPFFPRIAYVTLGSKAAAPWYGKLARAGFNSLHYVIAAPAWEVGAEAKGTPVEEGYYWPAMQAMKKAGLKLYGDIGNFFNMTIDILRERYGSDAEDNVEERTPAFYKKAAKLFAESCAWYDRHPEVLAYKIDEPGGQEGLDRCKAMWKGLLASGHKRPAMWVLNNPGGAKTLGSTADGIGIDCYPVPSRPLVQIAKYVDRTDELLRHKKAVWFVAQAFDWRLLHPPYGPFAKVGKTREEVLAGLPDDFVFTPTPRQIRCMTYLSLAHDVQGLLWWSVCWHYKVLSIVDFPEDWQAFQKLAGEVRHLSPALLSTEYVEIGVEPKQLGVHVLGKSVDGKLYVIAVNPSEDLPMAPLFRLPVGSYREVDALFENRSMKLSGNTFRDLLEPTGVHVYRIE